MKEPVTKDALELEVADFGPIVEAKVDLRPLTVFVGPSNTGKSYLAILIYALHRFFGSSRRLGSWRLSFGYRSDRRPAPRELTDESIDALLEMVRSLKTDADVKAKDSIVLPPPVAESLRSVFDDVAQDLAREVARCFGMPDIATIIRRGRPNEARVVVRRRMPRRDDFVTHTVTFARETRLSVSIPSGVPIPVEVTAKDKFWPFQFYQIRMQSHESFEDSPPTDLTAYGSRGKSFAWDLLGSICDMVLPSLVGPLYVPAYYLPADRTGVMHAHSVVVSSLIANAPAAGLGPAVRTSMLSGVLADFLKQLIEIDRTSLIQRGDNEDLGKNIEKVILGGSVRVDRSPHVDYPRFAYRPNGWKDDLALANASSMVSELAPVVLYLRHVVDPGDVLIVEEPESHLHPAMQVEFTRQLAALVAEGVRVIVTTHSEWLLEELANIVRRSELSEAERGDKIALRPEQVGAWLFEPTKRPKGSVVRELPFGEYGLSDTGFDDVASALHNDWAKIHQRTEERP